jgi:putative cell wall-binding protein
MRRILTALAMTSFLLTLAQPALAVSATVDTTAPGAPTMLAGFPATTTASDRFTVFWTNPTDESPIVAAYYRFDTAPTSNTDGTRVAPVVDAANPTTGIIRDLTTGGRVPRTIFIWLEDSAGLLDYTKNASTVLRPEGGYDELVRVSGKDRTITSVETSKKIFPVDQTASAVVLANGQATFDSLAGVPLAFVANAPILLINRSSIPAEVYAELQRVLPSGGRVYLLGGTSVINQDQENALRTAGYDIKRLFGADRYTTAIKVLEELDVLRGTAPTRLYLVSGVSFADALSVAPLAAFQLTGIALTEEFDLTQIVRDYLNANISTVASITIIGGTSVVPKSIEDLLKNAGYTVNRIAGGTRYETSRLIADLFVDESPASPVGVALANGESPADALPAGVHAAAQLYPMLLVQNDLASLICSSSYDFLVDYNSAITGGYTYGGLAVMADSVKNTLTDAIKGARIPCGTF